MITGLVGLHHHHAVQWQRLWSARNDQRKLGNIAPAKQAEGSKERVMAHCKAMVFDMLWWCHLCTWVWNKLGWCINLRSFLHWKSHPPVSTQISHQIIQEVVRVGGSFKNGRPIGEVGYCESRPAEQRHWWIDRCFGSPLFLSLSCPFSNYLPTYLPIYLCIKLSILSI